MTEKKLDIDQRPLEMPPLRQSPTTKTERVIWFVRDALALKRIITGAQRTRTTLLDVLRAILRWLVER